MNKRTKQSLLRLGALLLLPVVPAPVLAQVARATAETINPPVSGLKVSPPLRIERYALGPGDVVKIDIFNVPELSGTQTIAPDGTINLALIGAIDVTGRTLEDTARLLEDKLGPYLVRKIVNVTLLEARPLNIAVVGEVNRPGTRLLTYSRSTATGRDAQAASLTRALEVAGGVTPQADISRVEISRLLPGGGRQTLKVNLLALLNSGDVSQDVRVQDGDAILVPRLQELGASQPRQVTNASFAADNFTIQIALTGEVNRPGPQILSYARGTVAGGQTGSQGQATANQLPTLTRAIQVAGGITQRADIRKIQISRIGADGKRQSITANLWDLLVKSDLTQDVTLVDGDLISVPVGAAIDPVELQEIAKASFSPDKIQVQIIGEVLRPGSLDLRPNAPFTEAIVSAGGITNDGDWRAVELYRLNADGTLTRRNLIADLNLAPNEDTNPALRNRDVIVVRQSAGASALNAAANFLGKIVTPITLFERLINDRVFNRE